MRHRTWPTKTDSPWPDRPYGWRCSCGERCRGFWSMAGAASSAQEHMVAARP